MDDGTVLTGVFGGAVAIHAVLLAMTFQRPAGLPEWLIRLLLMGLIADNLILAMSGLTFGASWYSAATVARYTAHAIVLPPLLLAAVVLACRAGVRRAASSAAIPVAAVLALIGIAVGLLQEVAGIQLTPATVFGHTRLVSVGSIPPIATIVTNVLILIIAGAIWRASGWRWLFAAALLIFLVNAAFATRDWSILSGNLAEIVFAAAWVATLKRFPAA